MEQAKFEKFMEDVIFPQLRAVRKDGQNEYTMSDDHFDNFNRMSNDVDIAPRKVLWIFFKKHLDGISNFLRGRTSQREDVRGRIKDAIMYLMLLWGSIEDEKPSVKTKIVSTIGTDLKLDNPPPQSFIK
ncbi:MAG: hypothetical protein HN932_12875 [Candidatus Marinimicrobia bacterium]|jgi:hypothetical protein|nr:hypothetical protein [Candidatus Neomarinimicrobiota bacterium]MBT7339108.1 hypothetical protein [Candidatus Jacksonbacteria bacterium]